jgi:CubicO group peptidase (beta-lactamase class C family)
MRSWAAIGATLLLAIWPGISLAAQDVTTAAAPTLIKADVDAWLDGLLPYAMRSGDIAGGVVVVVKDGHVLTERGYGYADVARKMPMNPRETLIRPGSVSKLLTWTAVMQLLERGVLDLDTDVNRYLDFTIPAFDGKPITLRNIMTHTTGFEESLKGLGGRSPQPSLGDYLKAHLPRRIYPPGRIPAYSNYATALAGYIVERMSHQPFDAYVEDHILVPLGMSHSTFRQPPPPDLASHLSTGYTVGSDPPGYYEYIGPAPAGSMAATADDMARFMLAHLDNGRYGDVRILSERSAILMHASQPKIYPALNGMCLGFYEANRNGHRIVAHNGATQFFHSDLHLFPDDGVGVFISVNSAGEAEAATRVLDAVFHGFADRYFPAVSAEGNLSSSLETTRQHAASMVGPWEDSRRFATTFWSVTSLLNVLTITASDDGTLNVPIPSKGTLSFRETAPYVWTSGAERIQALVANGRPVMLGFGMAPPAAFLRQPWYRSAAWLTPALLAALAVLVITALSWPAAWIARRVYAPQRPASLRLYTATRVAAVVSLATALLAAFVLVHLSSDLCRMSNSSDGWVVAVELGSWIVFPGCVLVGLLHVWKGATGWLARVASVVFLASCCVLLWTAVAYHFLHVGTQY